MDKPVAFITGASRGIGAACAKALAEDGFGLVLHARSQEALEALLHELPADLDPAGVLPVVYELQDSEAIGQAFQTIFKRFRRLDVLVNNAGVMESASLGMIARDSLARTLEVNLTAAILHLQGAAKLMGRAGRGSIINMSSVVGRWGAEGQVAYAASKAGLIGATLAAAKELAARQVRVNAVAPGIIDTDLHRQDSPEQRQRKLALVRMGRMGEAREVAQLVSFLASDRAAYITGQVIGIDGGMSL
ncbi:SDR family oxidoreductase [Pelomonas sp. BJYL3]|uniref:SDR family oxidoreductase n=1 Tax=Pelomonas sp. BJYL3 TaxID=2976697 RepID=UPI0022B4FF7B|nr:SDR family NAD(P)-dependent oxidoreductase [Pelomonas sp. BJYL3]